MTTWQQRLIAPLSQDFIEQSAIGKYLSSNPNRLKEPMQPENYDDAIFGAVRSYYDAVQCNQRCTNAENKKLLDQARNRLSITLFSSCTWLSDIAENCSHVDPSTRKFTSAMNLQDSIVSDVKDFAESIGRQAVPHR